MAERPSEERLEDALIVRRGPRWARLASLTALGFILLLIVTIAVTWVERRPIARYYLENEFERRGVQATYHLDRVGLRTQQVSNLVIGDPRRPDLVARYAQVQMRVKWDGNFEVYRIVARGVRLFVRGVLPHVCWPT